MVHSSMLQVVSAVELVVKSELVVVIGVAVDVIAVDMAIHLD